MPGQERFKKTGRGSFFGDYFYAAILKRDPNHFLIALNNLFDWDMYSERLLKLYKGKEGRPPYNPVIILKMLFVSYLYNVSEREIERLADQHIMIKWFMELVVDEAPPDHSTLTAFKERILNRQGNEALNSIFEGMLKDALGVC